MGQKVKYLWYLRKKITPGNYSYYFVDASGTVQLTGSKTPIKHDPEGWEVLSLEYLRGFIDFGVYTAMSDPLKFVMDGAKVTKSVYYDEGIEGNLELYVEQLDDSGQTYSLFYRGDLDFARFQDNNTSVKAQIMDGSYPEQLRVRESANYELDIDTQPYFYVLMDGLTLKTNIKYLTVTEPGPNFPTDMYNNSRFDKILQPTVSFVEGDSSAIVGRPTDQFTTFRDIVIATYNWDTGQYFFVANNDTKVIATFDFRVALRNQGVGIGSQPDVKLQVRLLLISPNGATAAVLNLYTTPTWQPSNGSTSIYNISYITTQYAIAKGYKLSLGLSVITPAGIDHNPNEYDISVESGDISLDFETRLPSSYVKALRPANVFDNLVNEISNNEVNKSSLPLTDNQDFAITSFDAVRGLPNAKIKTNYRDFFESYNGILNLASYYDKTSNTHYIVDKSTVYDDSTTIYTLEEVSNLKVYPLSDEIIASFNIGYPKITIEGINGKEAYNGLFEFTTPITQVDNTKDLTATYIADPFTIELTRANLSGRTSTDDKFDNDNAILHVKPAPSGTYLGVDYYELERDPLMNITGVSFPSEIYNVELSPKRNLLRQGSFLHSLLYGLDAQYITFQTADRNQDLSTTLGAVTVTESADELIGDLDPALFLPVVFEFDCPNPINVQALIDANPYGKIAFPWKGNVYAGFILESKVNPATKASQTLKLLASPSTNLDQLKD